MIDSTLADTTNTNTYTETETILKEVAASMNTGAESLLTILPHSNAGSGGQASLQLARHKPLAYLAQTQAETCTILGQYWQMVGTEVFFLWDEDVLFCWPPSALQQAQHHIGQRGIYWCPIRVAEQIVGYIGVIGLDIARSELRARIEADAALIAQLLTLATGLAETLDELSTNKQIKKEMELAATIQMHLLSQKPPLVKGLDLFARSLPAMQIGGDFYSFHAAEHRPFIFTVGDVSGKGLRAALIMAMTRAAFDSAARFMPVVHPKALLSRVNEDLYNDFIELSMFVTIFAGCYNPENRQLSYANNGHSPVVYSPAGGSARLLEADGPPAGVLPFNLSENITLPFHPGDVLVIATDGFNEALNAAEEMFGYERLLSLIEQFARSSAEDIASVLYKEVRQFANGVVQNDDQTLVILKGVSL